MNSNQPSEFNNYYSKVNNYYSKNTTAFHHEVAPLIAVLLIIYYRGCAKVYPLSEICPADYIKPSRYP